VVKTGKKLGLIPRIILIVILPLVLVLPVFVENAVAQTPINYYVTVNPTTQNSPMYTPVGSNWTVSFQAIWSYGDNSGQPISNATVAVQVSGSKSGAITTLQLNTISGILSFNYSSSIAEIITFTPTELVMHNGTEWKPNLLEAGNNLHGFQSESVVVWWDTFHASLVSYDTKTQGAATVTVNVTYLLLPEDGLTLPEWATYSHQTFLPKTVHNATVTINDVKANETSAGTFTANVPIWLPTAYILVDVSQEGWVSTKTGFSFAQNANEPFWAVSVILGLVSVASASTYFLILQRKSKDNLLSRQKGFVSFGGLLLAITSVISLYWGLVGIDSTLHGFDWVLLTVIGFLTFGSGLTASIFAIRRKNQTLVLFALTAPMFTNLVGVTSSLDIYHLATPILLLIIPVVLSAICGFLISNADEAFTQHN
jgi:hypothetical protein